MNNNSSSNTTNAVLSKLELRLALPRLASTPPGSTSQMRKHEPPAPTQLVVVVAVRVLLCCCCCSCRHVCRSAPLMPPRRGLREGRLFCLTCGSVKRSVVSIRGRELRSAAPDGRGEAYEYLIISSRRGTDKAPAAHNGGVSASPEREAGLARWGCCSK
ncbi:hypothetical protein E2C01_024265 [Portunus trituberculatus]|uniref:Uncharacterized protein n=1 Tax=Portunus trituberculatus TaxID=210409 RepID=A0A5B7EDD5_PORTR|nr:hypothetical protein [Portunus trituberculatus]